MHLSRVDKAILCGVTVAGIGVITTAALANELGVRKRSDEESQIAWLMETDFRLPSMPSSKKEFMHMWASGYETIKQPLSAIFEITGQVLVAPIAMVAIDAAYAKAVESRKAWNGAA